MKTQSYTLFKIPTLFSQAVSLRDVKPSHLIFLSDSGRDEPLHFTIFCGVWGGEFECSLNNYRTSGEKMYTCNKPKEKKIKQ